MEYKLSDLASARVDRIIEGIGSSKTTELLSKLDGKLAELERYQEQKERERQHYLNTTSAGAFESLFGQSDVGHAAMNTSARLASGTSYLGGSIGNAVVNGVIKGGVTPNAALPPEALEAFNRKKAGKSTTADEELLGSPLGKTSKPWSMQWHKGATNLSEIERAQSVAKDAEEFRKFYDLSHLVDRRGDQEAIQTLRKAAPSIELQLDQAKSDYDKGNYLDALGNFVGAKAKSYGNALSTAADNPAWALGAMVENAPQLLAGVAAGPLGTLASVGAYATDEYQQAVADYQKKNNGELPPEDWVSDRQFKSALLAVPEFVSDRLTLGAGKAINTAAQQAGKVVDALSDGVAKTALGVAGKVANNTITRGAGALGLSGLGEYETEYFQQGIESAMRGEEASFVDKHISGATGFVAGSGTSAAITAGSVPLAVAEATKESREKLTALGEVAQAKADKFHKAVEQQDAGVYLDRTSDEFSPDTALKVLHKLSLDESLEPEKRAQFQEQAKTLLDTFERELKYEEANTNKGYEEQVAQLATAQEFLKNAVPGTEEHADAQMEVELLQEMVAAGAPTPEQQTARQSRITELQTKMESAQAVYESLVSNGLSNKLKGIDVPAAVEAADSVVSVDDTEGVTKAKESLKSLMLLSMASPNEVSAQDALRLATNTKNSLTEPERQYLTSFAESTQAIAAIQQRYEARKKTGAKVKDEVMNGDAELDQMGLVQYQHRMGKFLAAGDTKRADRLMDGLINFMASHTNKADALRTALEEYKATGQIQQVMKDKNKQWVVEPLSMEAKLVNKQGGYVIDNFSRKLVEDVQEEANAIALTQGSLQLAMGLGKVQKTGATANTTTQTNVAQQPADLGTTTGLSTNLPATTSDSESTPAVEPVKLTATQEEYDEAVRVQNSNNENDYDTAPENITKIITALNNGEEVQIVGAEVPTTDPVETTPIDLTESGDVTAVASATNLDGPGLSSTPMPTESSGVVDALTEIDETAPIAAEESTALKTVTAPKASKWLVQKTKGVLSTVPNLFSTLIADKSTKSLDGKADIQESDVGVINKAIKINKVLGPRIESLLKKAHASKTDEAFFDDLMIEKADGSLGLDENVLIASSLAGLSWVRGTMGKGIYSKRESVNQMLGRSKTAPVPKPVMQALSKGYVRYSVAAAAIGKEVFASLGLKSAPNAPANYLPKLEATLGAYILEALKEAGYAQDKVVTDGVFQSWFDGKSNTPNKQHQFITVSQTTKKVFGRTVPTWGEYPKSLSDYFKGEDKALGRIFDVAQGVEMPTFEPVDFTQSSIKNSTKKVPARLKAYLQKANAVPYIVKKNSWGLFMSLPEQLQEKIVGIDTRDASQIHPDNLDSVDAKNAGLLRGIELLKSFVMNDVENSEKGLDQEIFFSHFVQNQQRVGIRNAVNMQANKLHRFMFTTAAWDTEVSLNDPAMTGLFKLRVLEGFGVKTDNKTSFDSLMDDWFDLESDPVVQAGVAAVQKFLKKEELTEADQTSIAEAVAFGKENVHTFDALIALAQFKEAESKPEGEQKFVTSLVGEIDGINNGPIMTLVLLGVSNLKDLVQKGGFFSRDSGYQNSNYWKSDKANLDVYQTATNGFLKLYSSVIESGPTYKTLFYFTGSLGDSTVVEKAGRNLAKRPNTAFFFGSGKKALVEGMVENFVDDVLAKQEKILSTTNPAEKQAKIAEMKQALKHVSEIAGLSVDRMYADISKANFENSQTGKALVSLFKDAVAAPFTEVLSESYAEVSFLRNQITEHSDAMFHLYSTAYASMKEAMLSDMVAKGEITEKERKTYDLTQEQKDKLAEILKGIEPTVHSLASKEQGDAGLDTALPVMKTKSLGSSNPKYQSVVSFGRTEGGPKSRTVSGNEDTFVEPGVGTLPKLVHSSDSYSSHSVDTEYGSVNAHDARITGLKHYTQVGVELNQAIFELMYSYSPLREVYEARVRQFQAIEKLMQDPAFAPALKGLVQQAEANRRKAMVQKFGEAAYKMEMTPFTDIAGLFALAQNADTNKLTEMMTWAYVDQYGNEGGQYVVTEADIETIKRKHGDLVSNNFIPEAVIKTIEAVSGVVPTPYETAEPVNRVPSDLDLAVFFRDNQKVKASEALDFLGDLLNRTNRGNTFFAFLLNHVKGMVGDVTVTLVKDRNSVPKGMFVEASRGWTDGAGNIYVLDPSQSHSGLTEELVLHEVVHSILRQILDKPNQAQKASVDALNNLLKSVKAKMEKAGKAESFKAALGNLQEFVAWGMTNKPFQTELAKISASQKKNAFRQFVAKVSSLIFGEDARFQQASIESAFGDLIGHVAQLMETVQSQKPSNGLPNGDLLSMAAQPEFYSTESVFGALESGNNSKKFVAHLGEILKDVVTQLHGPYGAIKAKVEAQVGSTPLDAWAHAKATGQRVLPAKALGAGLKFSEKESFVVEQVEHVMNTVLHDKAHANSALYSGIERLYAQAKEVMKGKISEDLYRFVFVAEKGMGGRSDYMGRFIALGLGNQEFNEGLNFETKRPDMVLKGKTFMERLETVWRAAVSWLGGKMTGTYAGQHADDKLNSLVYQLVQSEVKARAKTQNTKSVLNFMEPLEDKATAVFKGAKGAIGKVADSGFVKNNRFKPVKTAGTLVSLVANERVEGVVELINEMRNKAHKDRPGFAMSLVNYVKGAPEWLNALVLNTKKTEKERLALITDVSKAVLGSFENGGKGLKEPAKAAVSAVLLRTGAYTLLDKFSVPEITELLENPKKLKAAIDAEVGSLSGFPQVHYYVKQAKGLAFYRTTGKVDVARQMLNAGNIAQLYGTGRKPPQHAAEAAESIERLVTLYGLQYSSDKHKNLVLDVMRTENERGDNSGILMTLKMHKHLEQESKQRLFSDSPALMVHGFTPEVLNPHTTFVVTRDPSEWDALEEAGYVRASTVNLDAVDPDQSTAVMFVQRGGGLSRYNSGAVSFTGMQAKGDSKHDSFYHPGTAQGAANIQSMNQIHSDNQALVDAQFNPDPHYNPTLKRKSSNTLLPLLNRSGQVVDYRYVMSEEVKDTLLERNNEFDHLLGVLAGSTFDKETSRENNKTVMQALYDHWVEGYVQKPHNYIHIHHSSKDPAMREIWQMIPDATKLDLKKIWGNDGIYVPKEMVTILFGYRKGSAADMFNKENKNAFEKFMTETISHLLYVGARVGMKDEQQARLISKQGAVRVRRAEAAWQEVVQATKDIIVVKGFQVLWDNLVSNQWMLLAQGVSLKDSLKYQHEALKGIMDYERDRAELAQLKLEMESGYVTTNLTELKGKMVELEDKIARNPVKELVDAGLNPTIVEDINMTEDRYSYKSQLTKWVDNKTESFNPTVMKVARTVFMTHDTTLYKFLSKTTQYSDFVGRYALYKHHTTKAKNPLSKAQAVYQASEVFVNYDMLLPKWLQYGDDMGVLPFTKYFLSIQRVLARNIKNNPLQVLNAAVLNNYLGNMPFPTDSSFMTRMGNNPFSLGALGFPGALTELGTVQASMALIK